MARIIEPRYTPEDYRDRPKDYDPRIADEIIERVGNGELLPEICTVDRDMPLPGTFLKWVQADALLEQAYIDAKRRGTEINLDQMVVSAMIPDPGLAGIQSRAWKDHVQMSDPSRYGPRATLIEKTTEDKGGVDYSYEVRRKIDELAGKIAMVNKANDEG